jgi:drug/metabolite transporter (DMT)-like permease
MTWDTERRGRAPVVGLDPAVSRKDLGLRASRLGVGAVTFAVVAWALSNVIVKIAHGSALELAFWRLWMGSVAMALLCAAARRRVSWSAIRSSAPAGVLFGVNLLLFFAALKRTNVADVLIIGALQPGLVLLVAGRMFGERVARKELLFFAGSIIGIVVFVLGSSETPSWSLQGDLLAVGALVVFTGYFLMSKRVRERTQVVEYMTIVTIVGALVVTPVVFVSSGAELGGLRVQDWLWLVLFLVAAQGSHLLVAWAHRQVDATVSSLIMLGEIPITAASAYVFLGEPVTWLMAVGGAIALASLGLIVRRATRAADADARSATPLQATPP